MFLTPADFKGFPLNATVGALKTAFDSATRKRGEAYFREEAVREITCSGTGTKYSATVQGSELYTVSLNYSEVEEFWFSECTCPMETSCKHAYATLKQLIAEHAAAEVQSLSSRSASSPVPKSTDLAALAEQRLGRSLKREEQEYLLKINSLRTLSASSHKLFGRDLAALDIVIRAKWWEQLNVWPHYPKTETEFWNYLALYLTGNGIRIPDFLRPVTDLDTVRDSMRRRQRAQEVERWKTLLTRLDDSPSRKSEPGQIEMRACLGEREAHLEWRIAEGNWQRIADSKARDFDTRHGANLSAEASLLWQPIAQRTQAYQPVLLRYTESWAQATIGRWLRQPLLRSLLTNEKCEPLVFHDAALRWQVTQPEDDKGDYTLQLIGADGGIAPTVQACFSGNPTFYLTAYGVFTGPPHEPQLLDPVRPNLIPAAALHTTGGLRLFDRIQAPPPPRLSALIRTVTLAPRLVANVTRPWADSETEYCFLDVLAVSPDAEHVERWNGHTWIPATDLLPKTRAKSSGLERLDRTALAPLPALLDATLFKYEYGHSRWSLRVTKNFAERFVPFLQSLPPGTQIELRGELASFQNTQVAGKIRLEATEAGMDWFDLKVIVDVADATLTQEEIRLLLDAKGKWVRIADKGWKRLEFALNPEEDEQLARLGLTPHELTSEPQRLHALQLADKAARKFLPQETCDRIDLRVAALQARITPDVPAAIQAELRPYQTEGFHFLAYLSANRFGGILADDMGLGKTLQTLTWLAWLRASRNEETDGAPLPSLVVCPKSVADNWRAEVVRFLPSLRVRVWTPADIKSFSSCLHTADLHVLNYSQLRTVADDIPRARFLAAILDEGQYIKNPSSLTAQIALTLHAEHRLILSGTPIENRLLDLWSLMSFAMPGTLGNRAQFARLYDTKDDPFARQRLAARVRPFLIRRTKTQVARDLPDRMEEDLYCTLEGEQKTLYKAELKRAQAMLLGVKTAAALNKQRFNFLTSLLRLRQICCHPRLVKPDSKAASAKVEALIETLEPLIEEGQKVLVFSQFVELLNLLRDEIKAREWKHWFLAGDTEDRGALVQEFQAATDPGVFLISLKAGGFGLNLTAASYVILFDPWWNPAVENQAIDRTHRIGQQRKVIAYRLLIKDSIEEKIRTLQKQKSALASDVFGEEKFSQAISLDDLKYLLEG